MLKVADLTVEKILSTVIRVLQSKDEIHLDAGFNIDITTIHVDVGAGRIRKVINIPIDRIRKQSILTIPPDDIGLCGAKAIVMAIAHLENDERAKNALKDRRRPALMKRALQLHNDAGVPVGPCSYSDLAKFEAFLNIQIAVISAENLNKVIYFYYFL